MIRFIKDQIKRTVYSVVPPPLQQVKYIHDSYSQAGEDVVIKYLFDSVKLYRISYLELGTNIPDKYNNTYLFYQNGSRGVCVEADETLLSEIKRIRPEDKALSVGVNIGHLAEADFYIFNEPALNTFSKEEAELRESQGNFKIVKVSKVQLKTVEQIIKENFTAYPDFLSIDIEGLDLDVLKTLDFTKYPIPVICAETCAYSENHIKPKSPEISEFMMSKGYFIYADTYINTIFVKKDWFYSR
jgi:FkbM family methyltransferase